MTFPASGIYYEDDTLTSIYYGEVLINNIYIGDSPLLESQDQNENP